MGHLTELMPPEVTSVAQGTDKSFIKIEIWGGVYIRRELTDREATCLLLVYDSLVPFLSFCPGLKAM
jgi:hypothetical protein